MRLVEPAIARTRGGEDTGSRKGKGSRWRIPSKNELTRYVERPGKCCEVVLSTSGVLASLYEHPRPRCGHVVRCSTVVVVSCVVVLARGEEGALGCSFLMHSDTGLSLRYWYLDMMSVQSVISAF